MVTDCEMQILDCPFPPSIGKPDCGGCYIRKELMDHIKMYHGVEDVLVNLAIDNNVLRQSLEILTEKLNRLNCG
jgi:hypothetical protein